MTCGSSSRPCADTVRAAAAGLALLLACSPAAEAPPPVAARPLFEPPAVGSYELPRVDSVADYELLDVQGRPSWLLGLSEGQVAVVSFVYRGCADADGCPLALATLRELDRALAADPQLAHRTRLVTASFDPERDRPEQMMQLRRHMAPESDWRFLTLAEPSALAPMLDDFGQDVIRLATADGEDSGLIRHVMKVFLVDAEGSVRNIYSAGFIDWRVVRNDILTLHGQSRGAG